MNTLSRCIQYDGGRMDEKILAYRSELQKEVGKHTVLDENDFNR